MAAAELFWKLDEDKNGTLSLDEIACRLSDFGILDRDIDNIIIRLDTGRLILFRALHTIPYCSEY